MASKDKELPLLEPSSQTDSLNLDAAALQSLSRRDMLAALLEAKRESDRRNYAAKTSILRRLLKEHPDEFFQDSQSRGITGLTHRPTRFRIHLPQKQLVDLPLKKAEAPAEYSKFRETLEELLDQYGDTVLLLKVAAQTLPLAETLLPTIWFQPEQERLWVSCKEATPALMADWQALLGTGGGARTIQQAPESSKESSFLETQAAPPGFYQEPWVLIKRGASPFLRGVTDVLAMTPGPANQWYGGDRPLASLLLGGMAGAGLGYLGGAVGENISGGLLQKGRLRRTLATLGALAGSVPGAFGLAHNISREGPGGITSHWPEPGDGTPSPDPFYVEWDPDRLQKSSQHLRILLPDCAPEALFLKAGYAGAGFQDDAQLPPINVDAFGRVIWSAQDPYTPMAVRAATMGLVDATSMTQGGRSVVTPTDIARFAVGMGTGWVSGRRVGNMLGVLAGLDPEAQRSLQQAGTWAGLLRQAVPSVFGGRY